MQTIDENRAHYQFVGKGIEKRVADGGEFDAELAAIQPPYLYKSGGR